MKRNYLVIRLSSMGDVALAVPVLRVVSNENPDARFYVVTRKAFQPLFSGIENIIFITPDLKNRHKGFFGLRRLTKDIKDQTGTLEAVIDLHNVLRSRIVSLFFKWGGTKVFRIDKGREEKKAITLERNKTLTQLKHTSERYLDVFIKAGLNGDLSSYKPSLMSESTSKTKEEKWIGIAPFAKHKQKEYPLNLMIEVLKILMKDNYKLYLFGGGAEDEVKASEIIKVIPGINSMINKLSLPEELILIQQMDVMLTMDSANMHMARLQGTPVVSVWGATHPFIGFSAFGQDPEEGVVQIDNLACRPCSIFGNKKCHRGDWACLNNIKAEAVVEKIKAAVV